jgi:glycosyltransferase involved in cell wall biosynthesis
VQPAVVAYASPLKLFEYLAAGLPVVAPNTPNIREVLSDRRNALLFDPEVEGSFTDALRLLCDDARLRQSLAEAARRSIDEAGLTWRANAERVGRIAASAAARAS